MESEELALSIPPEWEERFVIKRIKDSDIEITLKQRNAILECLNRGDNFVQIGKFTLMLNSIKSIDPYWGQENIPPRPKAITAGYLNEEKIYVEYISNQDQLDLWDKLFSNKIEKHHG